MYTLVWTQTFLRTLRKFLRKYPHLAAECADVFQQLERDPDAPRLRRHSLKGKHKDKSAVHLTYSHRIILILKVKDRELALLDIGDHATAYR